MRNLQTERLVLRKWQLSDADDLYEYACNPLVGPSAGWAPHQSRQDSETLIRTHFRCVTFHWAMVLPEHGKVIGGINLTRDLKRNYLGARTLGYAMNPAYWGNGYMTEAARTILAFGFYDLDCGIISVYHYPDNERSKRVIERLGFTYEGVLRRSSQLFDGQLHDNWCYSMTEEEFRRNYRESRHLSSGSGVR